MIIILKRNANPEKVEILKQELEHKGFKLHLSQGTQTSLIGLIGDTTAIHEDWLKAMDVVEDVRRIREPYKKASRSMHPENTVVDVYKRQGQSRRHRCHTRSARSRSWEGRHWDLPSKEGMRRSLNAS